MKLLIKVKGTIIVEGKYDKITLDSILDTHIIVTNGFSIFKDKAKRDFIRRLALKDGIIIMTDSDCAGQMIRSHIKQICPDGKLTNVYIPQIKGKEKRKDKESSEGFLGVEGMSSEVIIDALRKSNLLIDTDYSPKEKITKTDLYLLGLSGRDNSSDLREKLSSHLNIPKGFSPNAFLDAVNTLFAREEFIKEVKLWLQETDKS